MTPPAADPRRARRPRWWIAVAAAAIALVLPPIALLWLLPAAAPTVTQTETLSTRDVQRALSLARLHDPRRALAGVVRSAHVSRHEVEVLVNVLGARLHPGRWQLDIGVDRLQLRGSLPVPAMPGGGWLNVELRARAATGLPRLVSVTVGRIVLPPAWVEWAIGQWASRHGLGDAQDDAVIQVQQLRFAPQRIDILYAWGADAPSRLPAVLLPQSEYERLRAHATRLADLTAGGSTQETWSLSKVLPAMFELARQRSAQGHDAALENRAALLVLGLAANGISLGTLLPERRAELDARPIRLTLAGRRDFPQHLLVSAALAADAGTNLADLIGLYKELADARSGSGFSFNDMAANRAGARLGALAIDDPALVQQRLAGSRQEQDYMPDVSDLPEFMSDGDFRRRFGAPGAPAFERMMDDIDGRLGTTPLFR